MRRRLPMVVLALALTACGSAGPPQADPADTVTVFAAASLTEAFTQLGSQFEAAHPGTTVTFSFAGSSALAQQILAGAPADVFAAASPSTMQLVVDAGDATAPQVFARNQLEIAVPAGNPGRVTGLADFATPSLTIALCAPQVPCGAAAAKAFAAVGVTPAPDTLEPDVKAALAKVSLGEVDAALVYRTDVRAAGDRVTGIPFSGAAQASNAYPVATLAQAPHPQAAAAFAAFVLSPQAQRVLASVGFDRP